MGPVSPNSSLEAPLVDKKASDSSLDEPGGTPPPHPHWPIPDRLRRYTCAEWRVAGKLEDRELAGLSCARPAQCAGGASQMTLLKLFSLFYRVHTSPAALGRQTFGFHHPNSSPSPNSSHGASLVPSQHPSSGRIYRESTWSPHSSLAVVPAQPRPHPLYTPGHQPPPWSSGRLNRGILDSALFLSP